MMDLDEVKKTIQNFFQENTVTIVGSGLSLAEGIPGMNSLSSELQLRIPTMIADADDVDKWKKISSDLSSGVGLEQALHNTKPTLGLEEAIRKTTAEYIGDAECLVLQDIMFKQKCLRFSRYISHFNIRNNGLIVITTNYDRLIEYACEMNGIRIDTLFIGNYFAKYSPSQSKYMFCTNISKRKGKPIAEFAPRVTILKPHGCLSWHMIGGDPYSIPQAPFADSLIITPGINKYKEGYNVPFDIHRSKANEAIDAAQRYIIIGYGFSDDHLETHLVRQLENGKPALILTYSLSDKARNIIRRSKNITAICSDGNNGSVVLTCEGEYTFLDLNLWDLNNMLEEVF